MIRQHQAVPITFQEIFFKITFDRIKKFIKKDFSEVRVGGVVQDECTLSIWVENDPDPVIIYAHLLRELSRRFSWILQRQIRVVGRAIEIFWSKDFRITIKLFRKCEFDERITGISWDRIAIDSPVVLERCNSSEE